MALALYFYPTFRAWPYLGYFVLLMATAGLLEIDFLIIVVAACFYILLGIREFLFVRRAAAFVVFVYLFMFLASVVFFSQFALWWGPSLAEKLPLLSSIALPVLFYTAVWGARRELEIKSPERDNFSSPFLLLLSFLLWQTVLAALFLPLGSYHQAALVFGASVVFVDLYMAYLSGRQAGQAQQLSKKRLVWASAMLAVLCIFVLSAGF